MKEKKKQNKKHIYRSAKRLVVEDSFELIKKIYSEKPAKSNNELKKLAL
jgi:hypothetical protein